MRDAEPSSKKSLRFLGGRFCVSHLHNSEIFAISTISALGVCISHLHNSAIFAISAISAMEVLFLSFR